MNSALAAFLFLLWFAALVGVFVCAFRSRASERAECRRAAVAQFAEWQSTPAASQLGLGPNQCDVVSESETVGRARGGPIYSYTLTRFLRNAHGEYFMFKSTPSGPYVKAVEPKVAKIVLKGRYIAHDA